MLLELVETRAIASRIHPKLSTTSKVPYPKNLQVWMSTETSTKKKETCDEETLAEGTEVNPETHEKSSTSLRLRRSLLARPTSAFR